MASERRTDKQTANESLARARAGNLRQLLLKASRAINEDVAATLRAAGYRNLKNSHVFCLAHIDLNGTTVLELGERSNISKQAASKLVGELVTRGYLSTSRDSSDRRVVLVRFTPRGHALMTESFGLFAGLEREYSARVGAQAYRTLKRSLRVLAGDPGIKSTSPA